MNRALSCLAGFAVCATAAAQIPLSQYANTVWFVQSGGQPMPENLTNAGGPRPFSNITVNGGQPTVTATWTQTIAVNRFAPMNVVGFQVPSVIQVTESASIGSFYEPADQLFIDNPALDPILSTKLIVGNTLPGTMSLMLVDANPGQPGMQPYINDMFPLIPVPNGTPVVVWTGPVEPIRISSPLGVTIATNFMQPFQIASLPLASGGLDNAFGIFTGSWTVIGDGSIDGVPSPWVDDWMDMPQIRWKPHPGGWAAVVVGAPMPGPAGVLHNPFGGGSFCCVGGQCLPMGADMCLIAGGTPLAMGEICLGDGNMNGSDDACDTAALGDANCDGMINFDDIDAFILALINPATYAEQYPDCDIVTCDINGDGMVNFDDIDPFIECLIMGGCMPPP